MELIELKSMLELKWAELAVCSSNYSLAEGNMLNDPSLVSIKSMRSCVNWLAL